MTIDPIDALSLTDWLENEEASKVQRYLEEKIMNMLFSHDPSSPAFQRMAGQLAWLGSRAPQKSLLEREIIELNNASIEQCDIFKDIGKAGRKVSKFVANHAVEIAVGAAVVATGVGIALVTGYALSASVAGIVVVGAEAVYHSWEQTCPKIPSVPLPTSKEELVLLGQPFLTSFPKIELPSSANELLVTPDGIWANGQFFSTGALMKASSFSSVLTNPEVDWKTFIYYSYLSEQLGHETCYQSLGESALVLGYYDRAVQDLEKAIEADPTNPIPYLERGIAQFDLGRYEQSLEDYQQFTSQVEKPNSLSITEFTLGFAKGLPKGIYDSGEGMLLFFADFVTHPVQTSSKVIDSITTLVHLVRNDEWGTIAEVLSPEMYQLATQWEALPSDKRGEFAGYAIGKCGADILTPGALAKIASKSAKAAQELAAICKNLQIAQETLILETAAGIGNSVKIAEIVRNGQTMLALGEDVGFTAQEIAQLKQAGKLESAINSGLEKLASQSESEVLRACLISKVQSIFRFF